MATVGADGTVTALKEGTVVITAKCGEKSAECTVTVKAEAVGAGIHYHGADNAEPNGWANTCPNCYGAAGKRNR